MTTTQISKPPMSNGKKVALWIAGGLGGVILAACLGITAAALNTQDNSPPGLASASASPSHAGGSGGGSVAAPSTAASPAVSPKPAATVKAPTTSQANAKGMAESYLETQAFSRSGLIDQLKFEGFSTADATYGADHITVNWNTQADRMAKQYMETQHFSRSGLISQLKFEGFTSAQAAHGASAAGL